MKREQGWGLLELLWGVTAGGVLIALALSVYTTSARKQAIDDTQRNLGALVENLEAGVGRIQSYHGLTSAFAIDHHLVPDELLWGSSIQTPWGDVDLGPVGSQHEGLQLTLHGIPPAVCPELLSSLAPLASEARVGQAVVIRRFQTVPENLGACEEGGDLVLDRIIPGVGMKATWETW